MTKRSLLRTRVRATRRHPRRGSSRWRITRRFAAPGIVPRTSTMRPSSDDELAMSDRVPGAP
jgi:hypothetical protein